MVAMVQEVVQDLANRLVDEMKDPTFMCSGDVQIDVLHDEGNIADYCRAFLEERVVGGLEEFSQLFLVTLMTEQKMDIGLVGEVDGEKLACSSELYLRVC